MAIPKKAEEVLVAKIRRLPEDKVAEVEDFVEFLVAKSSRNAALDRLLTLAPALEAADAEPMSEDEIEAEIQATRAAGHAKTSGADRS